MEKSLTNEQKACLAEMRKFIAKRNKVSIILLVIILLAYYLFVIGVGAFPHILGMKIAGSYVTTGIYAGIGIILLCFITTGIYTYIANNYFDVWQNDVLRKIDTCNLTKIYTPHVHKEDVK